MTVTLRSRKELNSINEDEMKQTKNETEKIDQNETDKIDQNSTIREKKLNKNGLSDETE